MENDTVSMNRALREQVSGETDNENDNDEEKKCVQISKETSKWSDKKTLYVKTVCLFASYCTLGVLIGQQGSAFLDLQIITQTDMEKASFFFSMFSIGYLVGSPVAGVLYDHLNNSSALLVLSMSAMAVTTIVLPWCSPYPLMLVMFFLQALFTCIMDIVVNSETMRLWGKDSGKVMGFLHFSYYLGCILSPLFTTPFLTPIADGEISNITHHINSTPSAFTFNETVGDQSSDNVTNGWKSEGSGGVDTSNDTSTATAFSSMTTDVHFAFLISGIIIGIVTIANIAQLFCEKSIKQRRNEGEDIVDTKQPLPKKLFCLLFSIILVYFVLISVVLNTFGSFLATFLVKQLHWSKVAGAEMASVLWASFAGGCFLSIFALHFLSCPRLLLLCCTSIIVSVTGFLYCSLHVLTPGVSICIVMFGMAAAPTIPACFTWMEQHMIRTTGKVISGCFVAGTLGPIASSIVVGYMFQHYSPMWFCYLVLVGCVMCWVVLVCILVLAWFFVRPYQAVSASRISVPSVSTCHVSVPSSKTENNMEL